MKDALQNHSTRGEPPSHAAIEEWLETTLPQVEKPTRYLDHEIHVTHRSPDPERIAWLLILPDVYEIGMSHQGLRILYDLLNQRPDAHAERAFAPWLDMEARMRAAQIPLFALESRRPARAFDVVGFSLQYELLATNLVNLLDLAGIAPFAAARGEDDPLVAAGGPCTGNPEPYAEFVDFFLIGDGEEAVGAITESLQATRGHPRAERLLELARLPGVYVPRYYAPRFTGGRQAGAHPIAEVPATVRRTYVADLDAAPYPERPIVPLLEAVQDRLTLEIQRGCTQGCRFCQAGIFYRPVRERGPARLVDLVTAGLAASGWSEISLSSLSSTDYSHVAHLARILTETLEPARTGLSFSSLRVDTFSVELADLVARVRKTGLTFAPEAGSARLRAVINKRIDDADLRAAVGAAYARGWQRVKLYFMIGLPTETEEDLAGIVDLIEQLRAIGQGHGGRRRVTASIGAFVPKAHTPFQWEPFGPRAALRTKLAFLEQRLTSRWSPVRSHAIDPSWVEALLARGDRRLGRVIHRVWELGARFDGWSEQFAIGRWERALRECGVEAETLTGPLPADAPPPWAHIDLGVSEHWLAAERDRAYSGETTPDCREGPCTLCGLGGPAHRRIAPDLDEAGWEQLRAQLAAGVVPPAPAGQAPTRWRLSYAKIGRLRFVAHLDTGRLLARLLRMARWPLAYTSGHHPHPRLAFGPPLPLGIAGEHEALDLFLTHAPEPGALARLNERAPEGLRFGALRAVAPGTPSLTASARWARYRAALPDDLAHRARREKRLAAFAEADHLPVAKSSKGRQRTIDLKRAVRRLAWSDPGTAAEAAGAGAGARLALELWMQERDGHLIGPLPVLDEVLRLSPEERARCRVTREQMLDADDQPLVD